MLEANHRSSHTSGKEIKQEKNEEWGVRWES
jgi:hypothetical protein